jgi:hypothetical protein
MEAIVGTNKKSVHKAFKEHKPFIKKYIADELPKVFRITHYTSVVPGYLYLNNGITHLRDEPIDPCTDYYIPVTEFEPEDVERILKQDFKRRGEEGLKMRIVQVKQIHEMQKEKYPMLFKD